MGMRSLKPEFSHTVSVRQIEPAGLELRVAADADQRAALARRLGLLALEALTAEVKLVPGEGATAVHLTGRFAAKLAQACVVTLEPVKSEIEGVINRRFVPAPENGAEGSTADKTAAAKSEALWVHPENDDAADVLESDLLDVGEVLAEELALAIDPYPRLPGAELRWQDPLAASLAGDAKANPFAVLKNRV